MSATGRAGRELVLPGLAGDVGRHPDDYYRTPWWATDALLHYLAPSHAGARPTWLDPGCGDGAIALRLAAWWPGSSGIGIELDEARADMARAVPGIEVVHGDFLGAWQRALSARWWTGRVDVVVSNPPYNRALEFARRAQDFAPTVALLCRVGFLEARRGSERDEFLRQSPHGLLVLPRRPGFRGGAQETDSATYAWILFGELWAGRYARAVVAPARKKDGPQ
jgi:hypothetical protein